MQDRVSNFLAFTDNVKLARRDLPNTGDGKYAYQVASKTNMPIFGPTAADVATQSKLSILVEKAKTLVGQGPPTKDPVGTIKAAFQALEHPDAIDDRDGLFVQVLAVLCTLPQDTDFAKTANAKAITLLYNSLPHPPAAYIGNDPAGSVPWTQANAIPSSSSTSPPTSSWSTSGATPSSWPAGAPGAPSVPQPPPAPATSTAAPPRMPWAFREADGSNNSTWFPALGQSGRPYARDVQGSHPQPANKLPDAGEVFDALLRSRGDFVPHPGGNSALTFAYASLVTHSLFRTKPTDATINNTTSYLDLSPLYGTNQAEQDLVRNRAAGRGLLWNDAFAEDRLVLVPPAASALLVVFSRNHNYIAEMLLKINERKRWKDPSAAQLTPAQLAQQDEEIFQTARLVNCGHFMAMIFGDYVGGFLGLARDGVGWCMNPFDPIKTEDGEFLGRGEGNHVSVEFNLLYRWHAVTAQKDITWTEELFQRVFPGRDPTTLQPADFGAALGRQWATLVDPNPRTRTFANLTRGHDGRFDDDALADILQTATETPAAAYRARGHPAVFRAIEVMSIEQGRQWGVCTMNEFRTFMGLKPFATFEEWNSSVPGVAEAARQLYGHIDNLELYPGIQAEDTMALGPGSGICCGYTMTRAILGDAVALVRGDRFYTSDYTPANLTSWGFQDCARDPDNGAFGAALPRLLMRHLPRHYPGTSVYALFPFFTPPVMKANLEHLGCVDQYADVDGARPVPAPLPKTVDTIAGIRCVLGSPDKFAPVSLVACGPQGLGSVVALDDASSAHYAEDFRKMAETLIGRYSYQVDGLPGTRLDVVANVANLVGVHWAADHLIGLPLKTKAEPTGLFTEQEVRDMLAVLYAAAHVDVQPEHAWTLEHASAEVRGVLEGIVAQNLRILGSSSLLATLTGYLASYIWPTEAKKPAHALLARLQAQGANTATTAAQVVGVAASSAMSLAQAVAQIVDFYMDDARAAERAEIAKLAQAESLEGEKRALLLGYVREALRLRPMAAAVLRTATVADSVDLGGDKTAISVKPGDVLSVDFKRAFLDAHDFPDPLKVDPLRDAGSYALEGCVPYACLGTSFCEATLPAVLCAVFRLKNLRRAAGAAGRLASFELAALGSESPVFLDDTGSLSYLPGSLTLVYDQ